jgi:predicted HTH transcriptional regulator
MEASPEELGQKMGNMTVDDSLVDYDVIKKPRTNFTNNVLRRAIPKVNIQDKINSISVNKLNVLSQLRLDPTGGTGLAFGTKKVRTLNSLPKMHSLDSRVMNDILPAKKSKKKMSGGLGAHK